MFEKTEIQRTKIRQMVRLCMTTGETVEGEIFVCKGQRLTDLLNDDRAFIPVDLAEGRVSAIAKTMIQSATVLSEIEPLSEDPYKILRIESTASDREVREAWMARVKACHPDRLIALNLDEEIIHAARKASQRINAAYDDIIQARKHQRAAG